LKHTRRDDLRADREGFRAKSIKTRIETFRGGLEPFRE